MLSATPAARGLAQLAETGAPPWPPSHSDPADLPRWFKRNKYPLLAVAAPAPARLRDDVSFRRELAAEHEWYQTSRREYVIVRDAWRAEGIECLMIKSAGNRPSFPHTSDNLDILVRPEQGAAAREILRRLGYVELRNIEEPQKFLFRKFHRGRCVCAIHVHERVAWFVGFMDEAALWARMRPADDDPEINIPSPEDAVLINLAHACYENKVLRLNEVVRVRHALRSAGAQFDWAYLERVAAGRGWLDGLAFMLLLHAAVEVALHGHSLIPAAQQSRLERILRATPFAWRRLEELRSGPAIDLPLDLSYPFCKRLYYRKIMADPIRNTRERWSDVALTLLWGIKLKSRLRPQPGAIIALSGADGSGKTAHAEALVDALRLCEIKADYFWSRGGSTGLPGLVGRLRRRLGGRQSAPADDNLVQRRQRLKSPAARLAWSWLVAADQIGTYLLRAWLPSRVGRVVVADRYVYDTAVEMDASLPKDARWSRLAIAAMLRLAPRPTHGYVLDLSSQAARARKPDEPWHADDEDERAQYREVASEHDLRLLPNAGSFAEANDRLIREVMMSYMADFETWLNALFWANPSQKNTPDLIWARGGSAMKLLVVTNMYPTAEMPAFGTFVLDQVEALRRAGADVDVFFVNGRTSKMNYLWGQLRLWRHLARNRYDLIHAHYVLSGVMARAQWGHRVVLTHHGPEVLGHPRWQSWLCKVVTPFFDQVIYVSEEIRRALRDRDGWVIPCGVKLDDFHPMPRDEARLKLDLPADKPLVLWAGEYWRPEKCFWMVEKAMELVKAELPEAELVLLTKKPHEVVPAYMSACDALVLTSAAEGSPMVVKEAMACNLPVVSVRVGDVPEVIETTPGCALVERDPVDVAAKLIAVLRNPRRTDGRSRMDHLRHDRIAARLLEVYQRTVAPGAGPSVEAVW